MKTKSSTKQKAGNGIKRNVTRSFSPHPQSVAWNKFKETDDYKRLVNGSTIRLPKECEQYLANRINTAYQAGWDAAEKNFG